jgi:two-component system, NarL family, response regulator DesR
VIRTLVVGSATVTREGLVALLDREDDLEVIGSVEHATQVITVARAMSPDVALFAAELPGEDRFAIARALHSELPGCRCLMLSSRRDPRDLQRAAEAHVAGLLVNDCIPEFVTDAIRKIAAGRTMMDPELASAALGTGPSPFTERELDALRLAAQGSTTAEIAASLCLSAGTVRNYLSRAIAKTGGRNRVDAIRIAGQSGWL